MPATERVRQPKWKKFKRIFNHGESATKYVCEVIFCGQRKYTYWDLTTDPETLPANSTSYVISNISELNYQDVGKIYAERT